jgi:ribonuclease J
MKIYTIGGYNEVGMNMTAVESNNEIVIFDMGYNMSRLVEYSHELEDLTTLEIVERGVIPDDSILKNNAHKVKAIVFGHAHLDHCGAIHKLIDSYQSKIVGTPYTLDIIKRIMKDNKKPIKNELVELNPKESLSLSNNLDLEFIHVTHSIPGTVLCHLNTPEGGFLYANDFKLDNEPTFGEKPDYSRIKKLAHSDLKAMVIDTTRIYDEKRCESESVTKLNLKHHIDMVFEEKGLVLITTFSSHIERLRNIIELNRKRREIVMLGRSLCEYVHPAVRRKYININGITLAWKRRSVESILEKVDKNRENYLIICTGNQGEPNSVLTRLAQGNYENLKLKKNDNVIFSCTTIPTPQNIENRAMLENKLKKLGVRYYKDVHSHGHIMREDHRDMIRMVKAENLIPAHGETERLASFASLAIEEGYEISKNVHISQNSKILNL